MTSAIELMRVASAVLFNEEVFVYSEMTVDQLGTVPYLLTARMAKKSVDEAPELLGAAIRLALDTSKSWVEWSDYVKQFSKLGDPILNALGMPENKMSFILKRSGFVSFLEKPAENILEFDAWIGKRGGRSPIVETNQTVAGSCAHGILGRIAVEMMGLSLDKTLEFNSKKR